MPTADWRWFDIPANQGRANIDSQLRGRCTDGDFPFDTEVLEAAENLAVPLDSRLTQPNGWRTSSRDLRQRTTLDFVFANAGREPWEKIVVLLLEYFERGEMGPVPTEVRGPADPNTSLGAIWDLEREADRKD